MKLQITAITLILSINDSPRYGDLRIVIAEQIVDMWELLGMVKQNSLTLYVCNNARQLPT